MFPAVAFMEMFVDCAVFLAPTVLLRSIEQGVVCFADVGLGAAWACVFVNYT